MVNWLFNNGKRFSPLMCMFVCYLELYKFKKLVYYRVFYLDDNLWIGVLFEALFKS